MICANDGCENEFEKITHNQKYCCDECCREATNANIKKKNKEKKDRLSGKIRICKTRGCKYPLSKYSEDSVCAGCKARERKKEHDELMRIVGRGSL